MTLDRTAWQKAETLETAVERSVSDEYWRSGTDAAADGLDFRAFLVPLAWGLDDGGRVLPRAAWGLEEDGRDLLDAGWVLSWPPTCPGAWECQ